MRAAVERMLERYGRQLRVSHEGQSRTVTAFFQAVTGRGRNMAVLTPGPLGTGHDGQYVYIGPLEPRLYEGDELQAGEKTYILRRAEDIDGPGGPVYQWGMCVEKGAEDTWGLSQ